MPNTDFSRDVFDRIAAEGYLGDPDGILAYCYVRVSSTQQAEEGRSGLPRQLQHCHEAALKHHLKITWEMVYADDGFSGFEFENRPALSQLRSEIKVNPRSQHVVIEHLDRLSRNARWHQGFLLEEFTNYQITPIYWKAFSSEIERAVMGTIAEEGMRAEMLRMHEGMKLKAKSGRVTAKRARFGYMFVDGDGLPSDKARKDTHYALHPEKSKIVRWIYDTILRERKTVASLTMEMNQAGIPPIYTGAIWCTVTLCHIISDPVYKGEFYAHRWYREETGEVNEQGRPKGIMRQRPSDEWIKVSVPAIVTPTEWDEAQAILASHRRRSPRNMKRRNWLLSTYIRCDLCQYTYSALIGGTRRTQIRYYGCHGRTNERAKVAGHPCKAPYVRANELEAFVWAKIEEFTTNEALVTQLVEEAFAAEDDTAIRQQLEYVNSQIAEVTTRYERWKNAYEEKVITLAEYKEHREQFNQRNAELAQSKKEIAQKLADRASLMERKQMALDALAMLRRTINEHRQREDIPFHIKRLIIEQLVDTIWLDSIAKTVRIEGVLKADYSGEATAFVFSSSHISLECALSWTVSFNFGP